MAKAMSQHLQRKGVWLCAVAVRLWLVLSLWHAPLPVLHAHDSLPADSDTACWLQHHLVLHHPLAEPAATELAEWHFHWLFEEECLPGGEGDAQRETEVVYTSISAEGVSTLVREQSLPLSDECLKGLLQDVEAGCVFDSATANDGLRLRHFNVSQLRALQGGMSLYASLSRRLC